ncbi:phosphatidylserine decarboxylase [Candidatus Liberibacter americanus]|uniref:Phosphatidylserine decarboxylase proenzyme n=1 Tax=Candidatus Liberibacter americanus str. Sao Paulo TaxID=1261131 RepID=U6B5L3_9HYPH|nr:phosphatidylserine decarboxylase [Candidatus Liberibacter americanus]AHA28325.1 Phosphatidylserine decarboxylase [Candidatus Liberibacter americanus str. Sao Paulo]EMS36615.1 phosphatidylserine decarboxylase [Candidatus Liberibacter americanus PW_SP]
MNFIRTIRKILFPIHFHGWPFIISFLAIAVILGMWSNVLFWIGIILTVWCSYFFRDPERVTPIDPNLLISPADGRVSAICEVTPPPELELEDDVMFRVSIFMNIFDCHVNRSPISGEIISGIHRNGQFMNAELDKASETNERYSLVIETIHGKIGVVQIAGFIARRIVCWVKPNMKIETGTRFGLIRFGSRVDLFVPKIANIRVAIDQKTVAGETIIAEFNSNKPPLLVLRG